MHRQVERDQAGIGYRFERQALARGIDAQDLMASPRKPCGWRGNAEGLAAELISGYQRYLHVPVSIMIWACC
jgi:hypothetical protein